MVSSLDLEMAHESAANDFVHLPGLTLEQVSERYTQWAKDAKYEYDLRAENYKGPIIAADFTASLFPDKSERQRISILDVAAGSGFVGEELKARGFLKLDALEPSEGMLDLAKAKNIYDRTFLSFFNGTPTAIESNYYDVAITSGGMGEGHIPSSGMHEFIRVVKPGGLVIIAMRENYLTSVLEYKDRLEPLMKQLEQEGKWESVSRTIVPKYSFDNNGVVYCFKVKEDSP